MVYHTQHIAVAFFGKERAIADCQDIFKRKVHLQGKVAEAARTGAVGVQEIFCVRPKREGDKQAYMGPRMFFFF